MLVCSVILRPPHRAIAAELAELAEALDAPATGNIVFATLVDDPASVNESVDAYLGEIMLEAASAVDVVDASIPAVYAANISESATATDALSSTTAFTPANLTGLIGWWDASVTASLNLTGSSINSVADQSGGGNTMNWVNAKPTYSATGFNSTKPAIVLGSSSALQATSFPMGTGNTLTAWYVGTLGAASGSNPRALNYLAPGHADWNVVDSWGIYRSASTTTTIIRNSVGATSSPLSPDPAPNRLIYTINSSGLMTVYANGVAVGSATSAGNWATAGAAMLGREGAGGAYWSGPIGEAGIATSYSDATTVALLDAYLNGKWGSQSQHTYTEFDGFTLTETTLSNGNLTATRATQAAAYGGARSSDYKTAGKYYFEMTSPPSGTSFNYGILNSAGTYQNLNNDGTNCLMVTAAGNIWANNANTLKSVSSITSGATVCFAVDLTARLGWVRKGSGNWNNDGSADPATGVGGVTIGSGSFAPAVAFGASSVGLATTGNFGQSAYTQTPPSGFGNWPGV